MRTFPTTVIALVLALVLHGLCEERTWSSPKTYNFEQFEVQILNWELTRDKKTLLLHAKIKNQGADSAYFSWKDMITYETDDGSRFSSNFDALVDRNGAGLTRTVGEFQMQRRERVRITMPFLLDSDDLPGRFVLPDGTKSILVK